MKRKVNKDVKPRSVTYEFIVFPSYRNELAYQGIAIPLTRADLNITRP